MPENLAEGCDERGEADSTQYSLSHAEEEDKDGKQQSGARNQEERNRRYGVEIKRKKPR
jgi:hypothetical protein